MQSRVMRMLHLGKFQPEGSCRSLAKRGLSSEPACAGSCEFRSQTSVFSSPYRSVAKFPRENRPVSLFAPLG